MRKLLLISGALALVAFNFFLKNKLVSKSDQQPKLKQYVWQVFR